METRVEQSPLQESPPGLCHCKECGSGLVQVERRMHPIKHLGMYAVELDCVDCGYFRYVGLLNEEALNLREDYDRMEDNLHARSEIMEHFREELPADQMDIAPLNATNFTFPEEWSIIKQ